MSAIRGAVKCVDARNINYVVRGNKARRHGAKVGDFVSVYSKRTHKSVFAIVGDTGNPTGDEGSLQLIAGSWVSVPRRQE